MLSAAIVVIAAWLPVVRADDGADAPQVPAQRTKWLGSLRRKSTPATGVVQPTVVSSRDNSAAAAQKPAREPLGHFDWGDLGLAGNAKAAASKTAGAPLADSKVIQTQALLPADDEPSPAAKSGSQPGAALQMPQNLRAPVNADAGPASDPASAEPQQLEATGSGSPDDAELQLVQRPTGPLVPPLDESLGQGQQALQVNCDVERQKLKPINAVTNKITAEPGVFPPECGLGGQKFKGRDFSPMTYTWVASNLAHKPLYFEQPRAERYGQVLPPVIQPIWSATLFFITVPLLPYKMGIEPPNECVYVLGYYRPSSCAPMQIPGLPISLRGAIYECSMIAAFAVVLPP